MRRSTSSVVGTLAAVLALVACSADEGSTELPPLPTDAGPATTTSAPTSAGPATTTIATPPDTATPETSAPETTTPETTAPETTAPDTTAPDIAAGEPSGAAAAFLIGSDDDAPLLPLAWWDGSSWRLADDDFPLDGGETAVLTSVDDTTTSARLSAPSTDGPFGGEACFDGRTGLAADGRLRAPEVPGFGYSTLAVVAPWDVVPRPSNQVGLDVDEYREIGARLVDRLGGDGSLGEVTQVVRVDLDGDGIEEVLVTFEHIAPSIVGAPGDYSIVYLRSPAATGEVDDDLVAAWLVDPELPEDEFPFILRSRVMAVADLDGDGTMEVVLHRWYYEGASVEIFRIDDGTIESVAGNGCGA